NGHQLFVLRWGVGCSLRYATSSFLTAQRSSASHRRISRYEASRTSPFGSTSRVPPRQGSRHRWFGVAGCSAPSESTICSAKPLVRASSHMAAQVQRCASTGTSVVSRMRFVSLPKSIQRVADTIVAFCANPVGDGPYQLYQYLPDREYRVRRDLN